MIAASAKMPAKRVQFLARDGSENSQKRMGHILIFSVRYCEAQTLKINARNLRGV